MSVANTLIENSISSLSLNVVTNTTSITKLQPLIIVDSVPNINLASGAVQYAFFGKPQGGAVNGVYMFTIAFDLETADTTLELSVSIQNSALPNFVLRQKQECSTGCKTFFTYSGVVEITSLSSNLGVSVEVTTAGAVTNLENGSMVFTRIAAA